jgi:hypothetical protein
MKHWEHHPVPIDGCFGCKGLTLQMNTGDAKRDIPDKKWNSELQAYRDARAQGIQPAGTTMRHVQEAHRASEVLGKAYNADTMPKTKEYSYSKKGMAMAKKAAKKSGKKMVMKKAVMKKMGKKK